MKNIAIILSAGTGSRFGANIPKQFINLAGKNIIEYTLEQFENNSYIDEICIVANKEYHDKLQIISINNNFTKVKKIIEGGAERYDSSYEAIKAYDDGEEKNLLFHDAVRPFVSQDILNNCIKALDTYNAIDVAIPSADTIIKIDEKENIIENIPIRKYLQRGQTPQGFKLSVIKQAHEKARIKNVFTFTDDCGLVKEFIPNEKIYVVNGEEKNIKITYKEDLLFAEKLLQINNLSNINKIDFTKLKDKTMVIFGGHTGIGKEISTLAKKYRANVYCFSLRDNIDIKNIDDINKALNSVDNKHNSIDYVINCSAVLNKKPLEEMQNNEFIDEISTNYVGCVNIAKVSLEYLKKSKGALLFFTSSSYTRGRENYSIYSSTKAAVVNFSQAIAKEWEKYSINVNTINPARTKTPMRENNFGKEDENTLLSPLVVAKYSLNTLLSDYSGLIIDVKKEIDE